VGARICVGKIGAAHGVRGEVRLWTFTEDPLSITKYGQLESADGTQQFSIMRMRAAKDYLVAAIDGVTTRDAAEQLNGIELYVARAKLPPPADGEFYHADLIGLSAETATGEALGKIVAVHNFGAGDIIEIAPSSGPTLMLPFTNSVVPVVDLANGRVVIDKPAEIDGDQA
jgi:16S rRNA processing protein RimM